MSFWAQASGLWQHRPRQEGRERQGELDSGPSTHLSTQHGVGSSDTHRNRLNLLFPPPPVHYYGPPHRATATLLFSSHPLPCSCFLSVCLSLLVPVLFVIPPFFFFYPISPFLLFLLCFFFPFSPQQCSSAISILTVLTDQAFQLKFKKSVGLTERWSLP